MHLDPFCKAPDAWYFENQTQPEREQPWYHVLVDGEERITYAAQSNLQTDRSDKPIANPLVEVFFEPFAGHEYTRNGRPWDGSW